MHIHHPCLLLYRYSHAPPHGICIRNSLFGFNVTTLTIDVIKAPKNYTHKLGWQFNRNTCAVRIGIWFGLRSKKSEKRSDCGLSNVHMLKPTSVIDIPNGGGHLIEYLLISSKSSRLHTHHFNRGFTHTSDEDMWRNVFWSFLTVI